MPVGPFTSLYSVSYLRGGPAALLLRRNFDNAAVLKQMSKRNPRPQAAVFHGDQDQVIPVTVSRALAAENTWVSYHEMPGLELQRIVTAAVREIAQAMAKMGA